MTPPLAVDDISHGCTGDAKLLRQSQLGKATGRVQTASFQDVSRGQPAAMGILAVNGSVSPLGEAVLDVVGLSSEKEMIRSDARGIVALVADLYPVGNRTVMDLPGDPVGKPQAAISREVSITEIFSASHPYPAWSPLRAVIRYGAILVNLLPETIFNGASALMAVDVGIPPVFAHSPNSELAAPAGAQRSGVSGRMRIHAEPPIQCVTPSAVNVSAGAFRDYIIPQSPTPRLITQCAWCHDLKLGGDYLPMGMRDNIHEIDLADGHHPVSHGICSDCQARLEAEAHQWREWPIPGATE